MTSFFLSASSSLASCSFCVVLGYDSRLGLGAAYGSNRENEEHKIPSAVVSVPFAEERPQLPRFLPCYHVKHFNYRLSLLRTHGYQLVEYSLWSTAGLIHGQVDIKAWPSCSASTRANIEGQHPVVADNGQPAAATDGILDGLCVLRAGGHDHAARQPCC